MTKQVVAKRSLSEGTVQLEECIWDNGSVTYDVCLIYTSSQATSKNFHSIETIEELVAYIMNTLRSYVKYIRINTEKHNEKKENLSFRCNN